MFAFHGQLKGLFEDCGGVAPSYHTLNKGWIQFLQNLTCDKEEEFSCVSCGASSPEVDLFDGTLLACRGDPLVHPDPSPSVLLQGSFHRERVLFLREEYKKLLPFLCSSSESPCPSSLLECKFLGQTEKDFFAFVSCKVSLPPSFRPSLGLLSLIFLLFLFSFFPFFLFLFSLPLFPPFFFFLQINQDQIFLKKEWQVFLQEVCKPSPLCALFPFPALSLLRAVLEGTKPDGDSVTKLLHFSPLFLGLLKDLGGTFPPESLPFLQKLLKVAEKPFLLPPHPTEPPSPGSPLEYFPSLPKVRERGFFTSDSDKGILRCRDPPEHGCRKKYGGQERLTRGIMTLFCSHGVCLGFEVMTTAESPNIPFTILKTRFQQGFLFLLSDSSD